MPILIIGLVQYEMLIEFQEISVDLKWQFILGPKLVFAIVERNKPARHFLFHIDFINILNFQRSKTFRYKNSNIRTLRLILKKIIKFHHFIIYSDFIILNTQNLIIF